MRSEQANCIIGDMLVKFNRTYRKGVFMEAVNLSKRLFTIAKYVPNGMRVADIGSDHALLPSYLISEGISPYAIAGEVNKGPLEAARRQINALKIADKVDVRLGSGLKVINDGEVEVITIAGMGGGLIVEILQEGAAKLNNIERLILQPNVGSELVRDWLDNNKWNIINEEILEEDSRIYEVIVAEQRTGDYDPSYQGQNRSKEDLYRLGPILLQKGTKILYEKWRRELIKYQYILGELQKSKDHETKIEKEQQIIEEINWITEVIKCLEKDKV